MHKNSCYGTIVYIQHIKITESERVWKDTKMNRSGPNTWGGNDRNNNNGLAPRINNSGMPADEKDYNAQPGGYHDYNSDGDASRRGREGGNEGNNDRKKGMLRLLLPLSTINGITTHRKSLKSIKSVHVKP